MKHTPGKWYIEEDDDGKLYSARVYAESDTYRGTIAHCQDARHIDGIGLYECKANARLIAAAPDLLEALKEAREGLQYLVAFFKDNMISGDTSEEFIQRWVDAEIQAEFAIAKAEGKEGA